MGMNKDALRRIMDKIDSSNRRKANIWKPAVNEDGSQCESRVRILPYQHDDDGNPFRELYFYYEIGSKVGERSLVAPYQTYGEPDPVLDFLNDLRASSSDQETYRVWKNFQPKLRIYAPVLVRWEKDSSNDCQEKGVQWWGFSPTVFKQFLKTILSEDYEDVDITDAFEGIDFTVTTEKIPGKKYYETTILPARKESPLAGTKTKPNKSRIEELIESVEDIKSIFPPKSADELSVVLDRLQDRALAESSDPDAEGTSRGSDSEGEDTDTDTSAEVDSSDITARLRAQLNK